MFCFYNMVWFDLIEWGECLVRVKNGSNRKFVCVLLLPFVNSFVCLCVWCCKKHKLYLSWETNCKSNLWLYLCLSLSPLIALQGVISWLSTHFGFLILLPSYLLICLSIQPHNIHISLSLSLFLSHTHTLSCIVLYITKLFLNFSHIKHHSPWQILSPICSMNGSTSCSSTLTTLLLPPLLNPTLFPITQTTDLEFNYKENHLHLHLHIHIHIHILLLLHLLLSERPFLSSTR